MRTPPALATALLQRLAPEEHSLTGDLVEEFRTGRSRLWYWRQVLAAILLGATRHIAAAPLRTTLAVSTAWATLLLLFYAAGDATADSVSGWIWGWNRQSAYATHVWWPFQIVAVLVSYFGFALSGLTLVRLFRRDAGPMLIAYALSIPVVLAVSAVVIEILTRRNGNVPTPHTLFYVVSIVLPYQWRSGLLLAPAVTLVAGLLACPRRSTFEYPRA